MTTYAKESRLCRLREGAYVGGVCVGMAEYYELDPIVTRILAVLLALLTCGIGCIAYLVLWRCLPLATDSTDLYDITPESAESTAFGCVDCAPSADGHMTFIPLVARLATAASLMILFLIVAVGVSPLVPGTQWWQFWPIALLMFGLCLIIIPMPGRYEGLWHVAGIVLTSVSGSILPMSLGIMSWDTIGVAFSYLWPIVLLAVILLAVGLAKHNDALLLLAAICVVVFCLVGITFCVIPGEIQTLFLHTPTGDTIKIAIAR